MVDGHGPASAALHLQPGARIQPAVCSQLSALYPGTSTDMEKSKEKYHKLNFSQSKIAHQLAKVEKMIQNILGN